MIIHGLKAEFNEYFQSPDAELIMCLDPSAQWKGTIEYLKKDFRIVEYKESQLEVKADVELTWATGDRPKFILYLQKLTRDTLNVLKEYEFSGKVFEETILQSFRRWGIDFEREHESELEKILPILVAKFATKSRTFWQDRLTPENVRALLFDDETIRKILAAPETTSKELIKNGTYDFFCDFITERYGGPRLRDYDSIEWAQLFTIYLILTEVRAGSGHPSSFPIFNIKWAYDKHEDECISFMRDWLQNETYKEDFKRLSSEVEKSYDLSSWAAELPDYPFCESSLSVEKALEDKILSRINDTKTLDELRNILSTQSGAIEQMAGHFWSREGYIVVWQALKLSKQIIKAIDNCFEEAEKFDSISSLVHKYTKDWWNIDSDYRRYRGRFDGENKLNKLSRQLAIIYRDFQAQLNEKYQNMIEKQESISIEGIDDQGSFWSESISKSRRKRAVFLVDALRFELGCDLIRQLKKSDRNAKARCIPLISAAPTLTPIGMTSIVSGKDFKLDVNDKGEWKISNVKKGENRNLSLKKCRKDLLKKKHHKAIFYELEDLLKPSELDIGDSNPVIVFTNELDGHGHESGVLNLSIDYFGNYLDVIIKAIRRLGSIGIEEIHVVSDHGFVIIDELSDADKIPIPKEVDALYKGHRCLVGKDLPAALGIILDLPNSEGLQYCVPKGIGIFRARGGDRFLHGGLTLHESIIPHVEILFAKALPKYGAKLKDIEAIYNLIFEVELLRAIPSAGVLFGSPRYIEIVGRLDKDNKEILRQSGPDMVINQQNKTLKVKLRIKPKASFSYGDISRLELKDSDTGELLDSIETRMEVESGA